MKRTFIIVFTLVFVLAACGASASAWRPTENINFVVQSAAGGGSDLMARFMAQILMGEGIIEVPIVVDNLTGAGGVNAFNHTLNQRGNNHHFQTVNANFFNAPVAGDMDGSFLDFTPLVIVGQDSNFLVANVNTPYYSLSDVLAAARAVPRSPSISIGSPAGSGAVVGIIFELETGAQLTQIPFSGSGEGIVAVMGGQVDLGWKNLGEAMSAIESGFVRPIAIAAAERSVAFPDIPTIREQGYEVVYEVPRAVVGPPGMSPEAIAFYLDAFAKLNASERWQTEYVQANFINPVFYAGEDMIPIFQRLHELTFDFYDAMGLADGKPRNMGW
jgi:putative tricarboxylic transport membrane protein